MRQDKDDTMRNISIIAAAMLAATTVPALSEGDVAKGEAVFKRCSACHAIGEGAKNRVGPQLNGIIGRAAGGVPDYTYSSAMKKAGEDGLVWTQDNLIAYIESAASKPAE
jgi:cytochrome c